MVRAFIVAVVLLASIPGVGGAVRAQQREPPTLRDEVKGSTTRQSSPLATTAARQRQNQDDVIRVDTNLITIPATVMDRDARYITDLRKEDFEIFEDGVQQQVAFFASVEQPFTILFLLDTSGSMSYRIDDLIRAANTFVIQLRPNDQLMIVSFDEWSKVLVKPTMVSDLKEGIKLSHTGDFTWLYDAVDHGLKRMRKVRGRKAIVVFSDGVNTGSSGTAKSTLRTAQEQEALIYTVQFDTYRRGPSRYGDDREYLKRVEKANIYMKDLAQKTGGRHYQIENISDLEKTFGLVADELRRHYSLGYYPKTKLEPGQQRQIKVRVRQPNLVVRARDSYTVSKEIAKGR
ncbi:MAG TPA: VWA domain-containing protein [Pyrinomonadaceae bacterium]|nr:VWA domain-containing protein [Pyrinomonadaceae bacterium]